MCTSAQDVGAAFAAMYEIGHLFGASEDRALSLPAVLDVLRTHLGIGRSVLMLDNGTGSLAVRCSVGLNRMQLARACYTSSEGVVGKAFSSGMPVVIPDAESQWTPAGLEWKTPSPEPMEAAAFAAVPISSGTRIIGVLACDQTTDRIKLRQSDAVRVLGTIAAAIGRHLERMPAAAAAPTDASARNRAGSPAQRGGGSRIVGASAAMRGVLAEAYAAAPSRSRILLRGELGTGKGAIAEEIHKHSSRGSGAFVRVNCAMYTEAQLFDELFGKDGAGGTGQDRPGALERADGGTLFLDEIGEIAPGIQSRLLHVLRERELRPAGGGRAVTVDFRLICATSGDLEELVGRGEFRADLYHQINVVPLLLPPLRERREDIPALADFLLERYNAENSRCHEIGPQAMETLCHCAWTGNIRELENCIEHAATIASGNVIDVLPCASRGCLRQTLPHPGADLAPAGGLSAPPDGASGRLWFGGRYHGLPGNAARSGSAAANAGLPAAGEDRRIVKREQLVRALEQCGWVQAKAARKLNITPRQVNYALQKYRIDVKKL